MTKQSQPQLQNKAVDFFVLEHSRYNPHARVTFHRHNIPTGRRHKMTEASAKRLDKLIDSSFIRPSWTTLTNTVLQVGYSHTNCHSDNELITKPPSPLTRLIKIGSLTVLPDKITHWHAKHNGIWIYFERGDLRIFASSTEIEQFEKDITRYLTQEAT